MCAKALPIGENIVRVTKMGVQVRTKGAVFELGRVTPIQYKQGLDTEWTLHIGGISLRSTSFTEVDEAKRAITQIWFGITG